MMAKDIIAKLEEFDPEAEVGVYVGTVELLPGRKYEKVNFFPEFVEAP